jgi:hypothetical protein
MSRMSQQDRDLIIRRRAALSALRDSDAAGVLAILIRMGGMRAHDVCCSCGGINERTGLSCREIWAAAEREAQS